MRFTRRGTGLLAVVTFVAAGCTQRPQVSTESNALGQQGFTETLLHVASRTLKQDAPPIVTLTDSAAEAVRRAIAEQEFSSKTRLRLRVVPGGCQGFMHKLDLDSGETSDDLCFESNGIKVVVFRRQAPMVRGTCVDYIGAGEKVGFTVENPNFKGNRARRSLEELKAETDLK